MLAVSDAARCYHLLLNSNETDAEGFKIRLFANEPTASIYSLISCQHIAVTPETIKPAVIKLLDVAISYGFNIGQDPINNLFDMDEFANVIDGIDAEALRTFFRNLQRLQALVRFPEDLDALLRSPFKSAFQIAHAPKDAFVTTISHYGLPAERAILIHEHASLVDMRNEQVWAAMLASKTDIHLSALTSSDTAAPSDSVVALATPTTKQTTSYTQIFGDIVLGGCDDCNAVTSPAAYFVDLLRMLKNAPSDSSKPTGPSLLDKLTERRPDLLTMQLSCVNTNVLIPYIDLANEAMESFIKNVGNIVPPTPVPIQGFNMTEEDTSDTSLSEPQHTDYGIYQTQIAAQNFPLTVFPYSQALDTQRLFFSNLKVSLSDVVALFGSEQRLFPTTDGSTPPTSDMLKLAKDVLSSADAAEYLGLSPADHVAITGSSVYSLDFFKAVIDPNMQDDAYGQKIGRLGTAQYWGYESDQLMLSENNDEGLPFVKSQFLRRSEITVEQLLGLLRARTLQGQLVLENADASPTFSGKLEDLRLRHPTKDNAKAALTVPDCKLLQSFIRLWHKTGWTVQDLDCLITSFGTKDTLYNITPQTIVAMSAVQRISTLTGIEVFRLMPLWDLMDTNGDNSLYAKLFLGGKADRQDAVFGKDDQGRYLAGGLSLEENRAPLLAAFRLTEESFSAIVAAANIQNDKLDLANVTSIYRISLFCQILAIDPKYFEGLQGLLNPSLVFESPQAAFSIIKEFQELVDAGLSQEQLLFFTGNDQAMLSRGLDLGLSMLQIVLAASDIIINIQSSKDTLPVITEGMMASPADVTTASVKLFDSATAQLVTEFIESDQPFPLGTLLAHDTTVFAQSMLRIVSRATGLYVSMKLSVDEVQFFQVQVNPTLAVDFGNISFAAIQFLQRYRDLADKLNGPTALLQFLKWTSTSPHDGLVTALATLTALSETQIEEYLAQRFPGQEEQQIVTLFSGVTELKILLDCFAFVNSTGVPGLTLKLLFTLGTPIIPPTAPTDFDNAAKVRLLLRSTPSSPNGADLRAQVNSGLRQNQRVALVSYLLQHKYIISEGITDADGLFEFLLIDVQMGPCLETSRIKQAISTVQVYVRRCILGLEKGKGVSSDTMNMDRWNWMQNYRIWEANRKVFLYPENWLDASLRDDKSEVFQMLESSILQNDLDSNKIIDLIKGYVYGVGEIADLDVQAYLWKKGEDEFTGTFHFFARTRTAPYIYYYRTLDIVPRPRGALVYMYWQPWTKIDIEVPILEVDADGKPLPLSGSYLIPALYGERLFLFFPQIVLKTSSNPNATGKIIEGVGDEDVDTLKASKCWQIQMGWAEYRNGKWTPKQVSQAALEVRGAQETDFPIANGKKPDDKIWLKAQEFPSISSFKFWIKSRPTGLIPPKTDTTNSSPSPPRKAPEPSTSILMIEVERWIEVDQGSLLPRYINYPLGRFEMRGSQVILVDLSAAPATDPFKKPWLSTIPTVFNKMSWHIEKDGDKRTPEIPIDRGSGPEQPLLGIVTKLVDNTPKKDVEWTLSFNHSQVNKATGLIQDIITTESTISYITYPTSTSTTTFPSDVFQHTLDRDLISMSTSYEGVDQLYAFLSSVSADDTFLAFGKRNGPVHELSTPYALYNWELGAHSIMLLMERLQATGQYDLAISIAHLVFDPTIDGTSLDRCWLFLPFKELANGQIDSVEDILKKLKPSSGSEDGMATNILEWRKNPFNAHIVARTRPLAFMRRIIMKYIEILVASGDVYFRQNTLEALPLAIQRYVEASHVFGSAPIPVPKLTKPVFQSYADLEKTLDDFSNSQFDMELDFPFYSDPASRGTTTAQGGVALMGILKTTYFCVPSNPKLVELRNLIDDRLFKIRNCQDINGVVRSLALFEPPIDPGLLVRATAYGISISQLLSSTVGPMPNYRFQYLLQKALELCIELKSMGQTLLSIKEKKDTEALANLRARQDIVIQSLMIEAKKIAKTEAESSIDALLESRKGLVTRLEYFLALSGSDDVSVPDENKDWEDIAQAIEKPTTDNLRMTSHEKLEMQKADEAAALNQKATILDIAASIVKAIPDISEEIEPFGVGVSIGSITRNVAEAMLINSSVMRFQAQSSEYEGTRASRTGFLIKQLQDRRLQANMAGREIKQVDKQIATARIRVEMCERDIEIQQQQAQQARDTEEWLRSKYTSEQLYGWMEGVVRNLYHQTYLIADDLAQKAQKAFRFEKGDQSVDFIGPSTWDEGRQGMFSGENLYLSLKRLETAYMEHRFHDFEIVKNISLRQIRPWALLTLRETGTAEFDLPEVLFDFDFPGHYSRRIKSVGMTIPCIVGPYTSVNATLTLLEHRYRTKPDAKNGADYPQKDSDERFQTDQIPIQSIAVSHGQQDSGVFNLDFRDERYIPFEGAGAISKWRLELPTSVKQFDYNTISDIVLHVKYTAIQGGAAFRKAASDAASTFQKNAAGLSATEGMFALLDLKNDFPTEWHRLVSADKTQPSSMPLSALQDRLPFFTRGTQVKAETISVLVLSDTKINMVEDITLTTTKQVALTSGSAIGSYQVATAKDLTDAVGNWSLTLLPKAMSANVSRILIVYRYIL
ncbi:uncharacterized protein TRIVIDRAFT_172252 [Trichoderma virens Gv29-8]|uniref:Insecticidal toxin complex protein n=1 Tax=Hypocrea virens (strain Gv29-8 / FGSC 10586) TaxID=413071 RepID=G9N2F4_HYPVG|nr:uncharacterized protein TRIVIDRAFT_172252 [Trichoderma virens Gv29-8]EHK19265.1 hypothetical protein TRIVIDRAFT_172252 [Trichoderma virens Gv29-8]